LRGLEMNRKMMDRAVALGSEVGLILVGTADRSGVPHVAAASGISDRGHGRIDVTEWFCPGTLANLEVNPGLAVVVWDPGRDVGFQMLGESEGVEETAVMDGLPPGAEARDPLPQVERRILMRVDKVIRFSHAPHTDREE